MKNESKNKVSRRSMLATTGGAVVAGAVASPVNAFANQKGSKEIPHWEKLVGQTFRCSARANSRNSIGLKLLAVERNEIADTGRPKHLREAFSLVFKRPATRTEFLDGQYSLVNLRAGINELFLCEAMDMQSGEMVVEANFG